MSKYDQKTINIIKKAYSDNKWGVVHRVCEEYIEKYPNDNFVLLYYIDFLLKLGRKEKAKYLISKIHFSNDENEKNITSYYYVYVKLLLQEAKYDECLKFLESHNNFFKKAEDIYYVQAFCRNQLKLEKSEIESLGYVYQQIVSYQEKTALEYIRYKTITNPLDEEKCFNDTFDLSNAFRIIRKSINNNIKYYPGLIFYESIFKAENSGVYNGEKSDFIIAEGLIHTDKILTLFPTQNTKNQKYIDITSYLK